jgi:hypothetical protein
MRRDIVLLINQPEGYCRCGHCQLNTLDNQIVVYNLPRLKGKNIVQKISLKTLPLSSLATPSPLAVPLPV